MNGVHPTRVSAVPAYALVGATILVSALLAGPGYPVGVPVDRSIIDKLQLQYQQDMATDMGEAAERGRHHEVVLAHAREAREYLDRHWGWIEAGEPDSITQLAIYIGGSSYTRALASAIPQKAEGSELESGRLVFENTWNEGVNFCLAVLRRWPEGIGRAVSGVQGRMRLAELALTFSNEPLLLQVKGVPLGKYCFTRMATLPDSLLQCCLRDCTWPRPAPAKPGMKPREPERELSCSDRVLSQMAESVTLDAMVGFKYGTAYWSYAPDTGPRTGSKDHRIAGATLGFARSLVTACAFAQVSSPPDRALGIGEALEALRRGGRLVPASINPFQSVPGLRNPRVDSSGRMRCELVMSRDVSVAIGMGVVRSFQDEIMEICDLVIVDRP